MLSAHSGAKKTLFLRMLTIFASTRIHFSIGRIADAVHRPMMTLVDFLFLT